MRWRLTMRCCCAKFYWQYGWSLFHHGELALLSSCLEALPYTELIQSPNLVLLQAWLAQSQHRYTQVDALLERPNRRWRNIRCG